MKKHTEQDTHPAIIVAQLRIKGTSLRKLAAENDLYPTALSVALQRPWLKAEGIIANAIGIKPEKIWPSRYAKRKQKRASAEANRTRRIALNAKNIIVEQCSHGCNVNVKAGA